MYIENRYVTRLYDSLILSSDKNGGVCLSTMCHVTYFHAGRALRCQKDRAAFGGILRVRVQGEYVRVHRETR